MAVVWWHMVFRYVCLFACVKSWGTNKVQAAIINKWHQGTNEIQEFKVKITLLKIKDCLHRSSHFIICEWSWPMAEMPTWCGDVKSGVSFFCVIPRYQWPTPTSYFLFFFALQRNVSSEDAKAPPFIRALVTVVCEGAMERGNFIDKLPFLYILFRYSSTFFTSHFTGPFFLTRTPYSLIVHFVVCELVFCWEFTFFIITQILLLPSSCCITRLLVTQ